jgi:hypothetical protein
MNPSKLDCGLQNSKLGKINAKKKKDFDFLCLISGANKSRKS